MSDATLGPCGTLIVNSSGWSGLARCAGVVSASPSLDGAGVDLSARPNEQRVYVAMDPPLSDNSSSHIFSEAVSLILFLPYSATTPVMDPASAQLFLRLSTNASAGLLLIDHAAAQLIFVDARPGQPFLGKTPLYSMDSSWTDEANNSTSWVSPRRHCNKL
jgi:hypothetical protein